MTASHSSVAPSKISFTCRVVYSPSRALWVRELELNYSSKKLLNMQIDGVAVHGFSIKNQTVQTHLNNKRIALDLGAKTWVSAFRDQATGQGVCVLNRS